MSVRKIPVADWTRVNEQSRQYVTLVRVMLETCVDCKQAHISFAINKCSVSNLLVMSVA